MRAGLRGKSFFAAQMTWSPTRYCVFMSSFSSDSAVVMLVRVEKGTRDGEMGRRIGNGTGGGGGGWEEGVVSGALESGEWESGE